MVTTKPISNDAAQPMAIDVASQSPHVVAYRFWRKPPSGDWSKLFDGHTGDDVPDHRDVDPSPDGTQIAYWLGIGGHPNTDFRAVVTFSQGGQTVTGGECVETGKTDGNGGAVRETRVTLE